MNYKKMLQDIIENMPSEDVLEILRALDYADGDADFDGLNFKGENSYKK